MEIPWILMSILILIILIAILAVVFKRKKKHEPDYRAFFQIGLIWTVLGIVFWIYDGDFVFMPLGIVFLAIGLGNRSQWKKTKPVNKRGLLLALVAGVIAFIVAAALIYI